METGTHGITTEKGNGRCKQGMLHVLSQVLVVVLQVGRVLGDVVYQVLYKLLPLSCKDDTMLSHESLRSFDYQ